LSQTCYEFVSGVAIITSDYHVDVLDGLTGLPIGSTRLSDLKGHPYGIGMAGSEIRILNQQNKKFFVTSIYQNQFRVIDNFEITSDQGQFLLF
jgi:hypothetical protein